MSTNGLHVDPGWLAHVDAVPDVPPEGESANEEEVVPSIGESAVEILDRLASTGAVKRIPTGLPTLDENTRGGLPVPGRVSVSGAPGAGKTLSAADWADRMAQSNVAFVGILGADEEPDDQVMRYAQRRGFTVDECEQRDPAVFSDIRESLENLAVRFYGPSTTIETAAADTAKRAKAIGRAGVLIVDSIQTARSIAGLGSDSKRELVTANIAACRAASALPLLVIFTSEVGRAFYRSPDSAEMNPLASGKESGDLEYAALIHITLFSVKDHPDLVRAVVSKNRRGKKNAFEFFMAIDRERQIIKEADAPTELSEDEKKEARSATTRKQQAADVNTLVRILLENAGAKDVELRAKCKLEGLSVARYLAAKAALGERIEVRDEKQGRQWVKRHFLKSEATPNGGSSDASF